jgi:hypothetical protein
MEFANANKVYRKSGGSPSNDLSLYQTAGKISEKASAKRKILKGTGFRACVRTGDLRIRSRRAALSLSNGDG